MATVNYYLDKAFSDDRLKALTEASLIREIQNTKRQIYLNLSTSGVRLKVYTKRRIEQKFWDSNNGFQLKEKFSRVWMQTNTSLTELPLINGCMT